MVRVRCSHCPQIYHVSEERLGSQATCKKCQHTFTLEIATDDTGIHRAKPLSTPVAEGHAAKMPPTLGQYILKRKLGAGAMGEVWLAHDPALERDAALKLMAPGIASDPERRQRFEREAKTAARLLHPNTVAVYSFGVDGDHAYLAMELVDGLSLDKIVSSNGPLSWHEATQAICDAARGLGAAHDIGLVHRDVKPANLMRTAKGVTKVVDFGLARAAVSNTHLTQDGALLGTPAFMAPEQWVRGEVDGRSDLYSLICTYYFLLTGRLPFDAPSLPSLGYQHRYESFPDPREILPELPDSICRILSRGAQKEPSERYQTAGALVADLERVQREGKLSSSSISADDSALPSRIAAQSMAKPPLRGRKVFLWLAAGGIALALGIVTYIGTKRGTTEIEPTEKADVAVKVAGETVPAAKLTEPHDSDPTIPVEFQLRKAMNPPGSYALQFDGKSSRVRIPRSSFKFFGDTPLTIEAIVTPEPSFWNRAVLSDLTGGSGFNLILRPSRPLSPEHWYFGYLANENKWIGVSQKTNVATARRFHLAAVYDKDNRELRLFVDGKLNGALVKASQPYRKSDWDTIIGADPDHPQPQTFNHLFEGLIEQVSVSKNARYAQDFEPEAVLRGDEHTTLLYQFNEGTGQTAYDSSGKGNHAAIEGGKWIKLSQSEPSSDSGKLKN